MAKERHQIVAKAKLLLIFLAALETKLATAADLVAELTGSQTSAAYGNPSPLLAA